jgi:hypothetical protein
MDAASDTTDLPVENEIMTPKMTRSREHKPNTKSTRHRCDRWPGHMVEGLLPHRKRTQNCSHESGWIRSHDHVEGGVPL